jgi:signal peptidase I
MPTSRRGHAAVASLIVVAAVAVLVAVNWPRLQKAMNTAASGGDKTYSVPSEAMKPTLDVGDSVSVSTDRPFNLAVGDVVTTGVPDRPASTKVFTRIVAIGPAEVVFSGGKVLVNGNAIDEPYLAAGTLTEGPRNGFQHGCPPASPCHVPEGSYWGMDDYRQNSRDSRYIGPISLDLVDGVLLSVVAPPERAGKIAGTNR